TPPAAARGHLHDAERGARFGNDELPGVVRMIRVELSRERLARERAAEQIDDLSAFRAPADHRIDAEFPFGAGFLDLPRAGSAEDDGEAVSLPASTNRI